MMSDDDIIAKLEDTTKDATRHQLKTLQTILDRNAGASYLQPYLRSYPAPVDASTFRRAVPLSCYDDYADHIHQLADGVLFDDDARPLLTLDPLLCFFFSSGTGSKKPKLIPYFDSPSAKAISFLAHQGSLAILRRLFPPKLSINKSLWFYYAGNVVETKSGYKAMAATAYALHGNKSNLSHFLSMFVSPKEVILGSNFQQQMYCHLLCGLRLFDFVDSIRAPYAAGLIIAFRLLESNWEKLCEDLENGFPSLDVTDVAMRDSVAEVLSGPQVDLSKRIRSICEELNWEGIVTKLWPNVRYVKCVTTGSMEQYYSKLKYYAGEIPLLGGDYFASECSVGINFNIMQPPELTRFVILPTAAYFEFLPFDWNRAPVTDEQTVDLFGVELGKMYEVVVTTYRGLYRYCLGDIVRVVGFYNSSPEVEFVMRAPKASSDIITERDLMSAMGSFQLILREVISAEIVEFTGFLDLELNFRQLKVFIEVKEGCIFLQEEKLKELIIILKNCSFSLEDGLGGIYKVMKARGELGPLIVSIVRPGSFDCLSEKAIESGAPASQYKPPKIIRNRKFADLLEMSVVVTVCLNSLNG